MDTYRFTEVTRSEGGITISYYDDDGALAVLVDEVYYSLEDLAELEEGTSLFSAAAADQRDED